MIENTGGRFCCVPKNLDELANLLKKTSKKLFSKNLFHEIDVGFCGKWLVEIIKLTIKEDTTLFILPFDKEGSVSKVELLINDDEFSAITFSIDKYDYDEIISKIKQILN